MEKPHKAEISDLLITLERSYETIFGMLEIIQGVHNCITLLTQGFTVREEVKYYIGCVENFVQPNKYFCVGSNAFQAGILFKQYVCLG